MLIIVLANVLSRTTPERTNDPVSSTTRSTDAFNHGISPPSLHSLVADIADALDNQGVTFWLNPGLGLLPATDGSSRTFGRLSPWQDGIDLGVSHSDIMRIVLAQTSLQWRGIVAVESYFGLRLFHVNGSHDERYDYSVPFVDLVYFQIQDYQVVSQCCDCSPMVAGPCMKKSCNCIVCSAQYNDIFPLRHISIQDMPRKLPAPHSDNGMLLPSDAPNINLAIFDDAVRGR